MPSLFVIRGHDQGTRFELEEPILRLGRDPSCGVQLHDTEVSRHHAELRRAEPAPPSAGRDDTSPEAERRRADRVDYSISDLGSSNGTYVNGKRVHQHHLGSGDQVQVGSTMMLYTGPSEEPDEELMRGIAIAAAPPTEDQSRIIHSVTQEEGSRIFDAEAHLPQNSWLARARGNLQVMYRTALAVSHTLDIDRLLTRIMELIFEWVEADRGCIMLLDPTNNELVPKVRRMRSSVDRADKITISKTILDYVTERNEGVLTSDARQDDRFSPGASIVKLGVREAICVPMQGRYGVVGAIYIDTSMSAQQIVQRGGANKFTEDHLKLMIAIGHQAALAVEDTRYYSAMVQAERLAAVGQTIATLSHHIKNILQGIRGGSYLIEMGLTDHDESLVGKGWKIVEKNQNKISAMVMDMLTFSKEREPDLCTANFNTVVSDVVELMQVRAQENSVELHWQAQPEMVDMIFDPEGVHRAVLNVMTNAIDAAGESEGGRVEVGLRHLADRALVQISVCDNGPGIPADQKELLFSPFVSTKKSRGTGLGLPVSRKILHEHGGRILVESEPGQGATFTLELPAVFPTVASPTQTSTAG